MDSSFYDRFYSQMSKGTFIGMSRATPEKFQFSIKVPETITHVKRLDVNKGAITYFEEFLDKISPLRTTNKLASCSVSDVMYAIQIFATCLIMMIVHGKLLTELPFISSISSNLWLP